MYKSKTIKLNFWQYQLVGWVSFVIAIQARDFLQKYGLAGLSKVSFDYFLFQTLIEATYDLIGFTLTLLMWPIYRRVYRKKTSVFSLLAISVFVSFLFSFIWQFCTLSITPVFDPGFKPLYDEYLFVWAIWRTPVLLGWSLFYFGIKFWKDWNLEHDRAEKANLLAQSAQLQMLRYQLNPHFLFNSLNSIRAMVEEDKQTTKDMLTELAEFLRYSLLSKNYSDVPLREELNAIKHYFAIEKHRFEEDLEIVYDIDPEAEDFPVLSFLIHPLVENAVKHGMQTSPMPLKIKIEAKLNSGNLTVAISNTGKWLPLSDSLTPNGTGTGLKNIQSRLEQAYPGHYRFEIGPKGNGVTALIGIQKGTP
ncbi:MAG: histidine kinase [Bacteroidota bacterium]